MPKSHLQANALLKAKYRITAPFYDLLDYPWEKGFYQHMRPLLLEDLSGEVLEAGVGTGRNLAYYPSTVQLTGIDLSPAMVKRARLRSEKAAVNARIFQCDACDMPDMPSNQFDHYISTFMFCVIPDTIQPLAITEMCRVLKPGGQFRLVEMVYSAEDRLLRRQKFLERFVEIVYGARFDRNTQEHIRNNSALVITQTKFLKHDTYLLIEGKKLDSHKES